MLRPATGGGQRSVNEISPSGAVRSGLCSCCLRCPSGQAGYAGQPLAHCASIRAARDATRERNSHPRPDLPALASSATAASRTSLGRPLFRHSKNLAFIAVALLLQYIPREKQNPTKKAQKSIGLFGLSAVAQAVGRSGPPPGPFSIHRLSRRPIRSFARPTASRCSSSGRSPMPRASA